MAGTPVFLNESNFDAEVIRSDIPVLVDFRAAWCPSCRLLEPVLDGAASDYSGRVKFGRLDFDESPAVADRYGIRSLPSLILFVNGSPAEKSTGLVTRRHISGMLAKYVQEDA
jgi:thioredoxin 1